MSDLLQIVEALTRDRAASGKSPVANLGFISCANAVDIKHVPFYDPCILLVLSGRKVVFDKRGPTVCLAGEALAIPAPASFDIRNEPGAGSKPYAALIIPFACDTLDRVREVHDLAVERRQQDVHVLKFTRDGALAGAVKHYLDGAADEKLRAHRLMEILLVLATRDSRLLSFVLAKESWSQRVRAVVATDLARNWELRDVCRRLATSESTLRRNLREENSGFRELLYELRLTTALMQLLQTSQPVYQIAYDCGYQSVSRFSSNFHKRFGLTPTALREDMTAAEHNLAVSAYPVPL